MHRILFICHGNICRSAAAKYVMQHLVDEAGLTDDFFIDSAATSREELGHPVYPPMRKCLQRHGIACEGHRARQMTAQDYERFDYLIGTDRENLYFMNRMYGSVSGADDRTAFWNYTYDDVTPTDPDGKISLLLDYTGRKGAEVADPWYTGDFETTYRDVLEGCRGLLAYLTAQKNGAASDAASGASGKANRAHTADDRALSWELVKTEHIVRDAWIDFRRCTYRLPDGTVFAPFYNYSRRSYVVIVAEDTEGRFLCVRQYRHGIGEITTEFPAGGIETEDPAPPACGRDIPEDVALETAKRELLEETGCVADEWLHLLTIPSIATVADNYAYLYLARGCRKKEKQHLDDTEFLNVVPHTARQIEDLIASGGFQQAMHVAAWLLACRHMQ